MNRRLNYLIISFFTASLFLSMLVQTIIIANYALDQEGYTEKFCENIATPELNCNGTCHLSKELKLNITETESSSEEVVEFFVSIFSFQQLNELSKTTFIIEDNSKIELLSLKSTKDYINAVFKPPCFS